MIIFSKTLKHWLKVALISFGLFIAILAIDAWIRYWKPTLVLNTEHFIVYSDATKQQSDEIVKIVEIQYDAYRNFLLNLGLKIPDHEKLKLKLFKDRKSFRLHNRMIGWAEAFYKEPYSYQYYSADEINSYHWMIHEVTHQLNNEVANFSHTMWLDEGLADYFGTSQIVNGKLVLGKIDKNTYPVWWLKILATSGSLASDKNNGSVIALRSIVSGKNGPNINKYFNNYYLHWWSLTHFLLHYDNGKYLSAFMELLKTNGDVSNFERYIGNIDKVELEWYEYIKQLKIKLTS